jgi:HEAT repeat protein
MIPSRWAWCVALLASLGAAGCAGKGRPPEGAQGQPRFEDVIERSRLREDALDRLGELASHPDPRVRANALEALAQVPARAHPALARGLEDPSLPVRVVALMGVGLSRERSLAPRAREMLESPHEEIRASAIYALMRCGEEVDPTPLAPMLLGHPSPRVRAHIAFILGELGDPSAMGLLRAAARDPMPRAGQSQVALLRLQVAEAMIKLGDDSQLQTVRAALYPSRPEELEATALAVQIIGQVQDRGAVDQLIYLAAYRNERGEPMPAEVRLGAAGALARMEMPQGTVLARDFLESPAPALRAQAGYVLGQSGQARSLEPLARLMDDPEALVQVSASAGVVRTTELIARKGGGGAPTTASAPGGGS